MDDCRVKLLDINAVNVHDLGSAEIKVNKEMIFGLCHKGTLEYTVNMAHYKLKRNMVFLIPSNQMAKVEKVSPDMEATFVYIDEDTILDGMVARHNQSGEVQVIGRSDEDSDLLAQLLNAAQTPQLLDVKVNDEAARELRSLLFVLRNHTYPTIKTTDLSLCVVLIRAVLLLIIRVWSPQTAAGHEVTSQEKLARDFMLSLMRQHKEHRTVSYYADELGVTPKYLSTVTCQVLGQTSLEMIHRVTLSTCKQMLRENELSVSDIAQTLNFASASSFVRFFRVHTGVTPHAYRAGKYRIRGEKKKTSRRPKRTVQKSV